MLCKKTTLNDMLSDPLVQQIMRADRVEPKALEANLRQIAAIVASRDGGKEKGREYCC
ncbi:MAG: hypothetical protein ABUL48_02085 [Pseudorhodoplanes sp.]